MKIFLMRQPSLRPFLHGWRKAVLMREALWPAPTSAGRL